MKNNKLIIKHMSFANKLAKKLTLKYKGAHIDDVTSYAYLGLLQAAKTYDEKQGSHFKTYASYCIKGAVVDGLRNEKVIQRIRTKSEIKRKQIQKINEGSFVPVKITPLVLTCHDIKLDTAVNKTAISMNALEGVEFTLGSLEDELCHTIDRQRKRDIIKKAIKNLPAHMQKIIKKHYYEYKSLKETGKSLNFSKSWTSRLHDRALRQLAGCGALCRIAEQ